MARVQPDSQAVNNGWVADAYPAQIGGARFDQFLNEHNPIRSGAVT